MGGVVVLCFFFSIGIGSIDISGARDYGATTEQGKTGSSDPP